MAEARQEKKQLSGSSVKYVATKRYSTLREEADNWKQRWGIWMTGEDKQLMPLNSTGERMGGEAGQCRRMVKEAQREARGLLAAGRKNYLWRVVTYLWRGKGSCQSRQQPKQSRLTLHRWESFFFLFVNHYSYLYPST